MILVSTKCTTESAFVEMPPTGTKVLPSSRTNVGVVVTFVGEHFFKAHVQGSPGCSSESVGATPRDRLFDELQMRTMGRVCNACHR